MAEMDSLAHGPAHDWQDTSAGGEGNVLPIALEVEFIVVVEESWQGHIDAGAERSRHCGYDQWVTLHALRVTVEVQTMLHSVLALPAAKWRSGPQPSSSLFLTT